MYDEIQFSLTGIFYQRKLVLTVNYLKNTEKDEKDIYFFLFEAEQNTFYLR